MKTVRHLSRDGGVHLSRMTDEDAAREVAAGRVEYVPKHWWRAAVLAERDAAAELREP